MSNKFERILDEKVKKNSELLVLKQQWETIKLYVPKKLELISQVFPHYSSHDESHSIKILNNIWQILGRKVALLFSATDLWLLLSSAYLHDCGMMVLQNDFHECFSKKDCFKNYIKECQNEVNNEFHDEAMLFDVNENLNKIYFNKKQLDFKSYNATRYLISDFYRKCHAERSSKFILKNEITDIPSSIIPNRIKYFLSEICKAHTQSFNQVMELPYEENGLDTEYCHPRYIACLLRLGDLLDLDNNRFSKTMLETLGDSLPESSINHLAKHESFKRILINTKEISIHSSCDKREEAEETLTIIDWLKKELGNQKTNWNSIVPQKNYGYLPKFTDYKVILEGYNKLVRQESKEFSLNRSKVLELLQGSGIYSHPWQAIRELIQNSIDATLIRVWTKIKKNNKDKLLNECKNLPIEISINQSPNTMSENDNIWEIKIRDNGCGMNYNEIKALIKALSSSENKNRKSVIDEMPEWFKPSGIFGIGFQSVFLVTDKVKIKTKSLVSNKVFELDIPKIKKGKNSLLAIKHYCDNSFKIGTELSFNIILNKIPNRFSLGHNKSYKQYVVNNYDFIKNTSLDIEIGEIIDEICKYSLANIIPIKISSSKKDNDFTLNLKPNFDYYQELDDMVSILNVVPGARIPRILYRGQILENTNLKFYFVGILANILYSNAKELLTINRNSIREEKIDFICKQCILSTYKYIKNKKDKSNNENIYFSMFVHLYRDNILDLVDNKEDEGKYIETYKDYENLVINNEKLTLKNILEDSKEIAVKNSTMVHKMIVAKYNNNNEKESYIDYELELFIKTILPDYGFDYFEYDSDGNFVFKKNSNICSNDNIKEKYYWHCKVDYKALLSKCYFSIYFKRFLIPCSEEYYYLAIALEQLDNSSPLLTLPKLLINNYPVMVSPLFLEKDISGKSIFRLIKSEEEKTEYVDFVVKNSGYKKEDVKVRESLNHLIEAFSEFIDALNEEIKQSPFDSFFGG